MHLLELIIIAFVLSLDSFATSIAIGISQQGLSGKQTFRLVSSFSLAHVIMILAGFVVGLTIITFVEKIDHWVAFSLLTIIGLKFIYEGIKNTKETCDTRKDPTSGKLLLGLAIATSIDALVLGGTFAALEVNVFLAAIVVGMFVLVMTFVGTKTYKVVGKRVARYSDILGGIVLILLGIKILAEHAGYL